MFWGGMTPTGVSAIISGWASQIVHLEGHIVGAVENPFGMPLHSAGQPLVHRLQFAYLKMIGVSNEHNHAFGG